MSTQSAIKNLERKRTRIIDQFLERIEMVPGSYSRVLRKCGKENCWCSEGAGHPLERITWTEGGRSRTRALSSEESKKLRAQTENYKDFRANLRVLKELEVDIRLLLGELEKEIVKTTRSREEKSKPKTVLRRARRRGVT